MTSAELPNWMSYDSVADIYERCAVPWFTPIAADLVAVVHPHPGETVLDLGTGTGLAARFAHAAVAPVGLVLAVDPSRGMLRLITPRARLIAVVGGAPGLPFGRAVFDVIVANFVISHFPDLEAGLRDMVRVLKPGGRAGITAWAAPLPPGPGNDLPEAAALVAAVRERHDIDPPPPAVGPEPFEQYLTSRDALLGALAEAGLADLDVRSLRYRRTVPVEHYLSGWNSPGRHTQHLIGPQRWSNFVTDAADALHRRFSQAFSAAHDVWLVTARRR